MVMLARVARVLRYTASNAGDRLSTEKPPEVRGTLLGVLQTAKTLFSTEIRYQFRMLVLRYTCDRLETTNFYCDLLLVC